MAKVRELDRLLLELAESYPYLDSEEQKSILNIISSIVQLAKIKNIKNNSVRNDLYENSKLEPISDRIKTVHKITRESASSASYNNPIKLRALRNRILHNNSNLGSPNEYKQLNSSLWRVLEKSADRLDIVSLYNILAYCIGEIPIKLNPKDADPREVIEIYRNFFNSLDKDKRQQIVVELLIRLYSDPEFRYILEDVEKGE